MLNRNTWKMVKKHRLIYIMLIPVVVYFVLFSYYPLALGVVYSFRKSKLIGMPVFVGLSNYKAVVSNPVYLQAFYNTVVVGIFSFVAQFAFGLLIALSLNELRKRTVKSVIQSVTYIPDLLSWAIVGGIWIYILSPSGILNGVMELVLGKNFSPIIFMSEYRYARLIMVLSSAWKSAGYYAILFMAAIVSIDGAVYEAACIDGAKRLQQLRYITIPSLIPTMKVIIVLCSMGLLRNFDQIYVMANPAIYDKVRNLLLLVYQDGIQNLKIGIATAASTLVMILTFIISTCIRKLVKYDQTYI